MADVDDQRNAFEFLCEKLDSQEPFAKDDLTAVTSWTGTTPGTYWSKQFKPFVRKAGNGLFRVSEAFRPYATWDRFRQHVTQVRRVTVTDYSHSTANDVLIYEFFMPLTNEPALRATLDAMFYKDTIVAKLRSHDRAELQAEFPEEPNESDTDYIDRVCDWLSKQFIGYSISHVNGRFRSEDLATREEAAEIEKRRRYLIDETTAVTRFIFPCKEDEVERVRWFFNALFVESIIEVVNGEDEIWMVESGMRNCLHKWKVEDNE